jgi:predicted NAD/FAD-dependent oxidoreductase
MKIAIIGAGISGLTLANELSKIAEVTIFEKSRGVGGRMSTRSFESYQFDHGAQHFTCKSAAFKNFLQPLIDQKIVQEWHAEFCEIDLAPGQNQDSNLSERQITLRQWSKESPHYVAVPKMNSLCKHLARNLDVRLQTQVKKIDQQSEKKWQLFDSENKSLGIFDWVVSTAPSQQSADLMPAVFCHLETIKKIKMFGCFALMLAFDFKPATSWQVALIKNSKISWISFDNTKPERPNQFCLVAHSANSWAEEHMEDDPNWVQQELISEVSKIAGFDASQAKHANTHRWRYANIAKQDCEKALLDKNNQLAVCGDWLIHGRVEAAFTSAMELVSKIQNVIARQA